MLSESILNLSKIIVIFREDGNLFMTTLRKPNSRKWNPHKVVRTPVILFRPNKTGIAKNKSLNYPPKFLSLIKN